MLPKVIVLRVPDRLDAQNLLEDITTELADLGYGHPYDKALADSARLLDLEAMKHKDTVPDIGVSRREAKACESGYNQALRDVAGSP